MSSHDFRCGCRYLCLAAVVWAFAYAVPPFTLRVWELEIAMRQTELLLQMVTPAEEKPAPENLFLTTGAR